MISRRLFLLAAALTGCTTGPSRGAPAPALTRTLVVTGAVGPDLGRARVTVAGETTEIDCYAETERRGVVLLAQGISEDGQPVRVEAIGAIALDRIGAEDA